MKKLLRYIEMSNVEKYREEIFSMEKIELKGVIRYDPERENLKKGKSCCIVEIDSGITDYYRYFVNKKYGIELIKPAWGSHISIIQGEEAEISKNNKYWKKYEGKEIKIYYYPYPRYSGDTDNKYGSNAGRFWFLSVESYFFNELRNELSLSNIKTPHLTIGRKKN